MSLFYVWSMKVLHRPFLGHLSVRVVVKVAHKPQAAYAVGNLPGYTRIKDGAYSCYCAYVLRIARYSGFLWVVPTNTGVFLRGLKLYGESRT